MYCSQWVQSSRSLLLLLKTSVLNCTRILCMKQVYIILARLLCHFVLNCYSYKNTLWKTFLYKKSCGFCRVKYLSICCDTTDLHFLHQIMSKHRAILGVSGPLPFAHPKHWVHLRSHSGPREVQGVPDAVPEGAVEPPPLDTAWAESTRKKALLKLEKLDTDLKNYKGNSIKESIR